MVADGKIGKRMCNGRKMAKESKSYGEVQNHRSGATGGTSHATKRDAQ